MLVGSSVNRLLKVVLATPVVAALIVFGYFFYTNPLRQWIVRHPLQQIRESVVYCRGTLDPSSIAQQQVRTASFCIPPYLYDAWAARQYSPQMWSLFTNRALFEEPVLLRGFEPSLDRLVAKYKRHSAETFDFTSYRNDQR